MSISLTTLVFFLLSVCLDINDDS